MKRLTTEVFRRVLKPTTKMTVTITYNADGVLSLVGTDRLGSGQLLALLTEGNPAKGFTKEKCAKLRQVWERWHLNDMRAGTPRQEEAVRKWRKMGCYDYDEICQMLENINLLVDDGYRYGTAWLKEEVPLDVLEWLFSLPGEGNEFSDICSPEIGDRAFNEILRIA